MTTVITALSGSNTINQMMHNVNKVRTGITFSSNAAIRVPFGTTAQRPTAVAGAFRYNTQLSQFEGYTAEGWGSIGGGGGGLGTFKLIAGSYSANSGDRLAISTTASARTITLPGSPSADDIIEFMDKDASFATNNLTISRNGSTIEGSSANLVADISSTNFFMQYSGSTWEVFGIGSGETTVGADLTGTTSTATFSSAGIAKIALGNTNAQFAAKAATTTNMIAGTGLTGGGTLAANRTFNLATNIATANLTASGLVAGITGRFGLYADGINMEQGTGGSYSVGNASYIQRDSGGDLHITSGSSTARNLFFRTKTTGGTSATLNTSGDLNVEGTGVFKQGMPIRVAGGNNVVLALSDNGKLLMCTNTASAMSVRIPNNSAVAFPIGAEISLVNVLTHATANTLGIAQTAGVILQSKEAANTIADRFTSATLKKTATNTWLLIGNLA